VAEATTTLASIIGSCAALSSSATQPWHNTGATCAQTRAPLASKGEHACDVFARIGSSCSLVWRRYASDGARYGVWRMKTSEPRERVLDPFEALGPIEPKGLADPVPLFRAASS
jgi:hypothetical protein